MASIRDVEFNTTSTASTSFQCALPTHQTDDLLLFFATKNGNGGAPFTAPAGWTAITFADYTSAGAANGAFWKIATSSSETDPTVTSTSSDQWSGYTVSVKNADTTTPIQGVGEHNELNWRIQSGVYTTTATNSLLLYYVGGDQPRQHLADPTSDPIIFISNLLGTGVSSALGWSFRQSTGAAPRPNWYRDRRDDIMIMTIAINDDGSGDVPGYIGESDNQLELIHPILGTQTDTHWAGSFSTNNGNISLVNGVTAEANNNFNTTGGAGITPTIQALKIQAALNENFRIGRLDLDTILDLSTNSIITIATKAQASGDVTDLSNITNGGLVLGIGDSNDEWQLFQISASDSIPNNLGYISIVIDVQNAVVLDESGTPDYDDITRIYFGARRRTGVTDHFFTHLYRMGTMLILGGSSSNPATFSAARSAAEGHQTKLIQQQNQQTDQQTVSLMPIQIGDGIESVYFSIPGQSLAFPSLFDTSKKQLQFNVQSGSVGVEVKLKDGDTYDVRSAIFSGGSKWPYTFLSGFSTAATLLTDGHQVVNAIVSLQPTGSAIGGITFSECDEITTNGADLSGGNTINNTTGSQAITVTSQADLDKLANCNFNGNGVAIRVDVAGSITLTADNLIFSSNTVDIEYTGSGTLTWVNSNGSNASTSSTTGGGTVVIESPTTLTLNNLIVGSEVRIFDAGTTTEVDGVESVATSTFVSNINSATYSAVDISILSLAYENSRLLNIDLTSGNVTIPISQQPDRQYENP